MDEERLRKNLARNMRYLREQRSPRMSQTMLANKLGVTQTSISKYENGMLLPPLHVLAELAECFGFSMDDLLSAALPGKKGRKENK